eukprot:CAMPEP_0185548042 /NCGR_PEP_ID=MMETSP1381-20130426/6516_1 /TAXON_ID=298111 /ORGANISM="Pavlova sp., Strain CCMP459" /LENGTH=118 /DNA_ID=CAMNT_0028160635 /DNA_START=118 /DNA_END=473 /DNA_ORIENTATION=-
MAPSASVVADADRPVLGDRPRTSQWRRPPPFCFFLRSPAAAALRAARCCTCISVARATSGGGVPTPLHEEPGEGGGEGVVGHAHGVVELDLIWEPKLEAKLVTPDVQDAQGLVEIALE